jgi:hypothetical protein
MNKKNRAKYIKFSVIFAVLLVIAAFFIRNNTDILSFKKPHRESGLGIPVKPAIVKHTKSEKKHTKIVRKSAAASLPPAPSIAPADMRTREPDEPVPDLAATLIPVEVHDIYCSLSGRDDLTVVISLKFLCRSEDIRQEVLLKREDLKVIVRKVLAPMKLSEIAVEQLRTRIRAEASSLLTKGTVDDVEFTKFQPLL